MGDREEISRIKIRRNPKNKSCFSTRECSGHVQPFAGLLLRSRFIGLCTLSLPVKMKSYDWNWWQLVVIFRWLMMWVSLRGNRSKQLICTARQSCLIQVYISVFACVYVKIYLLERICKAGMRPLLLGHVWVPHKYLQVWRMALTWPVFSNECIQIDND